MSTNSSTRRLTSSSCLRSAAVASRPFRAASNSRRPSFSAAIVRAIVKGSIGVLHLRLLVDQLLHVGVQGPQGGVVVGGLAGRQVRLHTVEDGRGPLLDLYDHFPRLVAELVLLVGHAQEQQGGVVGPLERVVLFPLGVGGGLLGE